MSTIATITELLSLSQCQYRVYDLGRRIDKISKESFEKLENNQLPHATPLQGHAHFAICFWQKQSTVPYLWFVKLPLDERGLLNLGARNHFIAIIVEALGTDLSVNPTDKQEELLKNNPYLFTPSQYKLAMLNSLLNVELKQPPSSHYQPVVQYFITKDWTQWHQLGAQGITDFVARLYKPDNEQLLVSALKQLPNEVLSPLCSALENVELSADIIKEIVALYYDVDAEQQAMLLRALARCYAHPYSQKLFSSLLSQTVIPQELAIIIAGRCWSVLEKPDMCLQFLEALAQQHPDIFPPLFKDLVAIPTIRPQLFNCMRDPQRSEALAKAIGALFN